MSKAVQEERFRLSGRVRHRAVADEGVLVHLESGRVLVVSEVGLFLVQQLAERAMTPAELAQAVVREFEVDLEQAQRDAAAFLDQLRGEQALESSGGVDAE